MTGSSNDSRSGEGAEREARAGGKRRKQGGASRTKKGCSQGGCSAPHYARGYCKKHYTQILRHGRLVPERERGVVRVCAAPRCNRTDTTHEHCRKHARQLRVHGRLTPEREHRMGAQGCRVPGCRDEHRAKGFCSRHYNRERLRRVHDEGPGKGKGAHVSASCASCIS